MIYQTLFRIEYDSWIHQKEAEEEVEWKYEAGEEEKSQCEAEEKEGKAQAKIKEEEEAYEEEIHPFKTRKEMQTMSFESISVGCVR